jgi:hypothetical protein
MLLGKASAVPPAFARKFGASRPVPLIVKAARRKPAATRVSGDPLPAACKPNLRAISARVINCPEYSVRVTDEDVHINNTSWTATCEGQTYLCHGQDGLITCNPEGGGPGSGRAMVVPPPPPPPPMMH